MRLRNPALALAAQQSLEAKQTDRMAGAVLQQEVGSDLTNHRAELEAVAGTRGDDQHARMLRMPVQQKMAVGRVGVKARRSAQATAAQRGDATGQAAADFFDFQLGDIAVNRFRRAVSILAAVMNGRFNACRGTVEGGETIRMRAGFRFPNPDWEFPGRNSSTPTRGSNQAITCRSTRNGRFRFASASSTHGPAQMASCPASYSPREVFTNTPSRVLPSRELFPASEEPRRVGWLVGDGRGWLPRAGWRRRFVQKAPRCRARG